MGSPQLCRARTLGFCHSLFCLSYADRAGVYGYLLAMVTSLPAVGFGLPDGSEVFRIFTRHPS